MYAHFARAPRTWLSTFLLAAALATSARALNIGDVSFIAFNADGNDDFSVVTYVPIPTNTVVFFRDDEWNGLPVGSGGAFTAGEGTLTWNSGGSEVGPGTVVAFTNCSTASRGANFGTLAASGSFNLGAADEGLFGYQGTASTNPTVFLAAVGIDLNETNTFGNLAGTGLTSGNTAVNIAGDRDVAEYRGPRTGLQPADYRLQVGNTARFWITDDGTGDQSTNGVPPDVPFNLTPFFINNGPSKWLQPPDPTVNGMDVGDNTGSLPLITADDFLCTQTGPITGLTVWASWFGDQVDPAATFTVSIWSDQPTNDVFPYSRPLNMLCQYVMGPPDYSVAPPIPVPGGEWFYNPHPLVNAATPAADSLIFPYYFRLDPAVFGCIVTQQIGNIYWVAVRYNAPIPPPPEPKYFGCKTSFTHFNDDATYWDGGLAMPTWGELRYPAGHPFAGQSADLAFAVDTGITTPTTTSTTSSLVTTSTSTSTTADGELDFGDAPDATYPTLLANDGARHAVGGPWFGDGGDAPDGEADGQQSANALGDDFDGNDDEDGFYFPPLIRGLSTNILFTVNNGPALVEIWLDLDRDGAWANPAELIHTGLYGNGPQVLAYTLPLTAVEGPSFARCRIGTLASAAPTGLALDGEVEDHNVFQNDGAPDWCNLQFPPTMTTRVGVPTGFFYGQVWIDGVTSQGGSTPGLVAQVGYGPDGSDPDGNPNWTWVTAPFNVDAGNNDEHYAMLTINAPGVYDVAFRYTWFGGPYCYGDLDGAGNGYSPANAGNLLVLPEEICVKWSQPPDCRYGLDVASFQGLQPVTNRVADDFVSDGRPIAGLRWWGSYIGYNGVAALTNPPPGLRPVAFELSWYTDIPQSGTNWSRPGVLITNLLASLLPYGVPGMDNPGAVGERHYCTTDLAWAQPMPPPGFEHEYEYELELQQPWLEKAGHVYWLSVRAIYPGPVTFPWGWKTTPVEYNWNDDAVQAGPNWAEMHYPPPGWTSITNHPYRGQSVNQAFEVLTDVCPRRCVKWAQPPDLAMGIDMASWRRASVTNLILRADDFISDGRRITDIHWWGSYLGWMTETQGAPDVAPVPPPAGLLQPIGFDLSWHLADAFCEPTVLLTNLFVPMAKVHQVYFGQVDQSDWYGEPHYEHEYQYYVDLLDPEVSGYPWAEQAGTSYWLNIQAVFPDGFLGGPHSGWGWLATTSVVDCLSAVSFTGGALWSHGGLPAPHPSEGAPFDLSFELTTIDRPATNSPWYDDVIITNIVRLAGTNVEFMLTSAGDCGCGVQVLQTSTNLVKPGSGYGDVRTNVAPRAVNQWQVGSTNIHGFYRIKQTD